MKRWISSVMLAGMTTFVMAQAPFTIVRPADGSKVREQVRVLIPKDSVPEGAYVGVFLDGKLIEATVPPVQGNYRVYTLDTKARGIPDSNGKPDKLELVLYTDVNNMARVLERSSVNVMIGNQASIPVPNDGLKLRYTFKSGTQMVYDLSQAIQISSISEDQQKLGGKAAQMDVDHETFRLLYSVDNSYGDGSGLLRMQPLPSKGKDYIDLTMEGQTTQRRFMKNEMAPVYMKVTNTGSEIFGALPPSIPLFGTSAGSLDPQNLYGHWPLPTLPVKSVRPGDSWQSRFQMGNVDLSKFPNINTVVTQMPARGEFVGVEWEQGHPCAKIMNTIEAADLNEKQKSALDQISDQGQQIADGKVSLVETIWFSLDTHKVLKVIRDETLDIKTQVQQGGFPGMGGGTSGSGFPGAPGRPGARGPGNGPRSPGGSGGAGGADFLAGDLGVFQANAGRPGAGKPGAGFGQGPGMGGPPGAGGMGGTQAPPQNAFLRIRVMATFILEQ